ncbi:MAG: hypothetical protein DRI57_27360 [Deltaproteobacteria bacterium]|nr:MAG: hypothetical protein DRI57_27360 [Deltaproteobacteria bacterium]
MFLTIAFSYPFSVNKISRSDEMRFQHVPDLFSGVTDPLSDTPGEWKSSGRHPRNEDLPAQVLSVT